MSNSCPHSEPEPQPLPRALAAVPAWLPAALAGVCVLAAVLVRGPVGAVLLGAVAVSLVSLTVPVWNRIGLAPRMARLALLAVLLAGAVVLAVPR